MNTLFFIQAVLNFIWAGLLVGMYAIDKAPAKLGWAVFAFGFGLACLACVVAP